MKRLLCMILVLTLTLPAFSALADDESFPILSCVYDTYIEGDSFSKAKQNETNPVIFAGDVYDRTVFFEFDISDGIPQNVKGAVLRFVARPSKESTSVTLYGCEAMESFNPYTKSISNYTIDKAGKAECRFSVLDYLNECIENGRNKAVFAVRSNGAVLPVFSREAINTSDRPTLTFTESEVYIKGTKDFEFPILTEEMLASDIAKMQQGGHPYLFFRQNDLDKIKEGVNGGNEFLVNQYAGVKKNAETFLATSPRPRGEEDGIGISRGFEAWEIVSKCAFVYLMEGDSAYAERAYKEVEYFATLESFGSKQFIDIAQITFAAALCYDWLYNWMNTEQRETIKNGYMTKHFEIVSRLFNNPNAAEFKPSRYSAFFGGSNHTVINNTMTFVGALAFADDENIPFYADLMAHSIKNLDPAFENLYPDSSWFEGPSYWNFVGPFFARMFACMKSGLGSWYGYENIPCVVNTGDYQLYAQSNQGYFMVNDCTNGIGHDPEKYFFAIMQDNDALKKLVLDIDKPEGSVFLCIWYDTELDHNSVEAAGVSRDKYFRNTDQVIFRDTWEGNQELYTGMLVMPAYLTHGHMNSGTFVLDALGERWITNQGGEAYMDGYFNNEPDGERWKWHATRAEANSCLVINPSGFGGQYIYAEDTIDKYVSGNKGAYAWADLTETYKDQVYEYKRGLMLTNNRRTVVLQDEAVLSDESEVYSFVNFLASDFEISEDKKSVIVKKGNKKVFVNIYCDVPYEVDVMRFAGLPTSQLLPGSNRNKDLKKLFIRIPKANKFNIRLELTPYLFDEDIENIRNINFIPISEWSVDETLPDTPMLSDLKFDGKTAESFNPHNRCYELPADVKLPKIEAIADESRYDVSVTNVSENVVKIIVSDKNDSANINSYIVYNAAPKKTANVVDVSNLKKIGIKRVTASAEPQEENKAVNVLDGDLSTRWSANSAKSATGEQSLVLTLDKAATVNCVALAFFRDGTERIAYFDIQISSDGAKWETVGEFDSSGVTDDFEYFEIGDKKASHIRVVCYGTNVSQWNSITEAAVYGK